MNVFYSHVVIPELRYQNIFDKQQSLNYSTEIQNCLHEIAHDIKLDVTLLPHAYSHFSGNYSKQTTSKDDIILFDILTIKGTISLEKSNKTTARTIAKQVFFLFVKLLHELAHACIFKTGRLMISQKGIHVYKKHDFFTTPATHALTGEAGNAIER